MQWYFFFFLVSGFCSVLYEVVWLRLAMAEYGVTTPVVSLVLSTFMLGLGLGSWGAGRLLKKWRERLSLPPLRLYALTELLIGISALVVPIELYLGRELLEKIETHGLSSSSFYLAAGIWIALSLVPWCACMGATFPFAMFAIEEGSGDRTTRSFSYLYLANVLGAVMGAVVPLFLIEALGFRNTLRVSSVLNFILAISAFTLSLRQPNKQAAVHDRTERRSLAFALPGSDSRKLLALLFGTGLTSMAAEVVWVRMFTPWLGTAVYAFAAILAVYLGATYIGSLIYRKRLLRSESLGSLVWVLLAFSTLLPLLAADPRLSLHKFLRLALGVVPFSALLGFLTPLMVDRVSSGDGERAGRAYAVNVVGCIVGPLLSGFLLLPWLGERVSLSMLALPWFAVALLMTESPLFLQKGQPGSSRRWGFATLALASAVLFFSTSNFESQFSHRWVRRDYTATVVAKGDTRPQKRLMVNGQGMTGLLPITKMMAHLPLAMLDRKPANILIICFGMGTTHRSALSWGISSTVVELVPSVPKVYGFFHADGPALLQSPQSHLVIDDGRLFLERTSEQYDVITVDPPPPVEAAGSSLLYSKEFYALVKRHLRPGGILQQWLPNGEPIVQSSVAKALQQSFPNVRAFVSVMDFGVHFLASMTPVPPATAATLASRMPARAATDMMEWGPESSPERQFAAALSREFPLEQLIRLDPDAPAMEDDRPVNEYYYLRHRPEIFGRMLSELSGSRTIAQR
ncbi:MAG: fused MFS/spermidine synthase [Candidatus Sulfotelmatobacter sp.]